MRRLAVPLALLTAVACAPPSGDPVDTQQEPSVVGAEPTRPDQMPRPSADVVSVKTREVEGGYEFAVGIASPDTGCDQYANWWEVVSEDGELLYRRPLSHSHIDEQPFVRSGGPVPIDAEATVWVRGHMHPIGYGGQAMKGSAASGFSVAESPESFALQLAYDPPLSPPCRW